jgi:branched-chain amino acid transport system ATP-binding protein
VAFLELEGVTIAFGGLVAVNKVDLQVDQGEILGLIGPNGAGKTTIFNIISGFLRPNAGKIVFNGENITGLQPHVVAKKGIVRTFQLLNLWSDFTVMDAIRVALQMKSGVGFLGALFNTPSYRRKEKAVDKMAMEVLGFLGMAHMKDQVTKTLSHGWQRTLSLGVCMATGPPLLLLDEPVTALSPERTNIILDFVKQLRNQGSTVMIIEHNMRAIYYVCDRIVVIHAGSKIAEGTPTEIRANPAVVSAYLGVKKSVT